MTVLPNAPIDDETGLPVPTIAVATDAGVSVIKDDGTVVDIRRTSDDDVHHVDLHNRVIMFMELGAIYVATIPCTDQSGDPNSSGLFMVLMVEIQVEQTIQQFKHMVLVLI